MRLFTSEECAEIVKEFDATENKFDESNEGFYKNSRGVQNLSTTLKHVDRITEKIRSKYPGAIFANTYTREYRKGSILKMHTDRKELDLTISVCLEKSIPKSWPLHISRNTYHKDTWDVSTDETTFKESYDSYDMAEGVGAICEGRKYPHWRDTLECEDDERAVYVFYHWSIPKQAKPLRFKPILTIERPNIQVYDNFLSESECGILMWLAQAKLERNTVVNNSTGDSYVDNNRTSFGMSFGVAENPLIKLIETKLSLLTGIPVENGEGIQILRYQIGQEYKPHFDYFDPNSPSLAKHIANNRICTVLMYLTTPDAGGETTFPDAKIKISARRGSALVFSYDTPTPDTLSLHGGAPVIKGEKWVATKWFHKNKY